MSGVELANNLHVGVFLDVIFLAHSGHFILPISMLVYNFLLVRRMSWCYALRMSVVDDAMLQMSFVDVYVIDDAIRYRCLGRRQLHTHTHTHNFTSSGSTCTLVCSEKLSQAGSSTHLANFVVKHVQVSTVLKGWRILLWLADVITDTASYKDCFLVFGFCG